MQRLKETAEGVAKAMGAQASVQFRPGYIAQKNDDRVMDLLMETAAECVGKEMIFQKPYPSMGVEDFAFYSAQRPSVFFFAGTGYPDRKNYGIHHGRFEADERALGYGGASRGHDVSSPDEILIFVMCGGIEIVVEE